MNKTNNGMVHGMDVTTGHGSRRRGMSGVAWFGGRRCDGVCGRRRHDGGGRTTWRRRGGVVGVTVRGVWHGARRRGGGVWRRAAWR